MFDDFEDDDFDFGEFFDIGEDDQTLLENRYIKPKITKTAKTVEYKYAKDMANEIKDDILSGERIFSFISGNFIFGDFIEAFVVESNSFVDELTISTLSVSLDNIDSLHNLVSGGYVGKLNLIVSDYWYSHYRSELKYLYDQLDINDTFTLAAARLHTKITLFQIGDKKIVMRGSANLRSSSNFESFEVETCPNLYEFNYGWHKEIIEKYGTINKSVKKE